MRNAFQPIKSRYLKKENMMAIATINPASGELIQTFEALTSEQIEEKIQR
jgi:acyl-CoA reductase-like NAD-dependent aldehyde dehydrogenase